jgi:hypothetical protein
MKKIEELSEVSVPGILFRVLSRPHPTRHQPPKITTDRVPLRYPLRKVCLGDDPGGTFDLPQSDGTPSTVTLLRVRAMYQPLMGLRN